VKGEVSEQQLAAAELRQDVSRLNEERSDRQQSLKDLATQYDRESLQLSDVSVYLALYTTVNRCECVPRIVYYSYQV